jgi:hypothetical protein
LAAKFGLNFNKTKKAGSQSRHKSKKVKLERENLSGKILLAKKGKNIYFETKPVGEENSNSHAKP